MAQIQKQFEDFHDEIKLKRFDENATLREKRDIIIKKIEDGLDDKFKDDENGVPSVEFIDQGSYAVDLGIIPEDGDYDIDEGAIFDLYIEDYSDPTELKKWIKEIMEGHTLTPPKIKNPCVTITYSQDEEPIYHVDIPVYAKSKNDSELYIAWGKEHSNNENKYWDPADPKGLNEHIKNRFSGDDKKQFKRIVRYLKKWKDVCFKSSRNSRPPSVGITIAACEMFNPHTEYNSLSGKTEYVDLKALKNFVWNLKNKFTCEWDSEREEYLYSIYLELPVTPKKDIFSKMSKLQMTDFYNELDELYDALVKAEADSDPHTACKLLVDYFGSKFPVPEAKESRYQVGKSNSPSSFSA
ncbi:cyclic GMP-AMP synthase DncV-like nucleotidyltransferase [Alkalithermobacter paradoxus]|uniref:Cyclic GMP-AMP synthase n=1 Tax=Alkalithermobacter paradoxus TaxID=29349 RepID=A0A1V4I4F4_9FIRM|nr:hypothetical protein CLOTH_19850 [[Clostridium] thermoalcaliphilum]